MISHAPAVNMKPANPCGCGGGCGDPCRCESGCCDLECLVRPRFFCGQILTDADLTAAVEWARSRFALARYRDGWGVVCGLNVSCRFDDRAFGGASSDRSTVYVHPGYAVDCCGNDLVVCQPIAVDLGTVCVPADEPCERLPLPSASGRGETQGQPGGADNAQSQDCWASLWDQVVAVNLSLQYHEDLTHGQRAAFRNGCGDAGPCEYTRVVEQPRVCAELTPVGDCRAEVETEAWHREFNARLSPVRAEIGATVGSGDLQAVLHYLQRHPPHSFCFIEDYVCCLLGQSAESKGDWPSRIAIWLYLDRLLYALRCECGSCSAKTGVPIARVLLKRIESATGHRCRVMMVDTGHPHRRPLRRDPCRPLATGALDLVPFLWQPKEHAKRSLEQLGFGKIAEQPAEHRELLAAEPLLAVPADKKRELTLWTVPDPTGCERVAAFRPATRSR